MLTENCCMSLFKKIIIQSLSIGPMLMLSFIFPLRHRFASISWKLLQVCLNKFVIPFLSLGPVMILSFISPLRHKFASINWKLLHVWVFLNFIYSIPIHRACDLWWFLASFPLYSTSLQASTEYCCMSVFVIIPLLSIRPVMILSFISPLRHRFAVIAVTQVARFLFV